MAYVAPTSYDVPIGSASVRICSKAMGRRSAKILVFLNLAVWKQRAKIFMAYYNAPHASVQRSFVKMPHSFYFRCAIQGKLCKKNCNGPRFRGLLPICVV